MPFVMTRRLLMALLLIHSTTAQQQQSLLLSLTSLQQEQQCVVVGCCLDDCCSAGTSWDSLTQYCVSNPNSRGFNGTHSSDYAEGCMSRECCNDDCCGTGTRYSVQEECCIPIVDSSTTLSIDFVPASPVTILLLESLFNPGDTPVIQVETSQETQVHVVEGIDIFQNLLGGGNVCSFREKALEKDDGNFVTIPLNGKDVVVYACLQNIIVGRCIHVYTSSPVRTVWKECLSWMCLLLHVLTHTITPSYFLMHSEFFDGRLYGRKFD